jgi:putative spermidine/putrescine transport system ATP-binding protein
VRLQGQIDKLPGQLSGGQQQRVAIARAIVIEPPLVLMDEPLSNLDAKLRLEMRAEIRRIHNQLGATTIYVTHDQDEALSLADRIVVMRDGEIRRSARRRSCYSAARTISTSPSSWASATVAGRVASVEGERGAIEVAGSADGHGARQRFRSGDAAACMSRPAGGSERRRGWLNGMTPRSRHGISRP